MNRTLLTFLLPVSAQEKEDETETQEKKETTLPPGFVEKNKDTPPFHSMTEIKNGYIALTPFVIPIFRNDQQKASLEIKRCLKSKSFANRFRNLP